MDRLLQQDKVVNLELALPRLDGLILRPDETFSFWRLVGRPSRRKGYRPGMVLTNGRVAAGTGGGLCWLSNLIDWLTLHTPLTAFGQRDHRRLQLRRRANPQAASPSLSSGART